MEICCQEISASASIEQFRKTLMYVLLQLFSANSAFLHSTFVFGDYIAANVLKFGRFSLCRMAVSLWNRGLTSLFVIDANNLYGGIMLYKKIKIDVKAVYFKELLLLFSKTCLYFQLSFFKFDYMIHIYTINKTDIDVHSIIQEIYHLFLNQLPIGLLTSERSKRCGVYLSKDFQYWARDIRER